MTQGRRIALFLVAALGCQTIEAQASVICDKLRASLASAPVVTSNSREARRYSSAVTKQNFEIRKARQDMQRLNCGGSIITYGSDGKNACNELSTALQRMEDNKRILTQKRDALLGTISGGPARSRLLAALDTNGCNAEPTSEVTLAPRQMQGPQLPRALTSVPDFSQTAAIGREYTLPHPEANLDGSRQGQLRTMCVSTCDGSFFPISSAASPLNFRRDAEQCSQMCPGTSTELFYHQLLTQESADMVSAVTGEPYRSLPNAFAYLSRPPGEKPACSCNLADYHRRVLQSQKPKDEPQQSYSAITEIRGTMEPAAKAQSDIPQPQERAYDPSREKVRRVGPAFLPAETSSIDLRNPASPGPQPLQQ
ncbi:DUF2865 domain-containing protein [Rhizobium sp. RU36D]|uniref:DUF2865 domain-containing protein n=1 Tax=Rhizobium sp. RU36D TaxID=1907415 RepID=UPI0009D8539E|nr:DUF2865 domain-containing protein [Rhizobium sp. RU36D]SMC80843.1 Protein of unknown function [Rhizobium sp. RU36D]